MFVTHDQEEAFVLGDEVAVMHGGRIVQQAVPSQLYARPASRWVATFVGDANLVPGTADGDAAAATPVGPVALEAPARGDVEVVLRPEELRLLPPTEAGAPPRSSCASSTGTTPSTWSARTAPRSVRARAGSAPASPGATGWRWPTRGRRPSPTPPTPTPRPPTSGPRPRPAATV